MQIIISKCKKIELLEVSPYMLRILGFLFESKAHVRFTILLFFLYIRKFVYIGTVKYVNIFIYIASTILA